jgi:monothiol glutaredoxin
MSQESKMSSTDQAADLPMASPARGDAQPASAADGETNELREAIAGAIAEHDVILVMKGTPEAPACGFSARTVAALQDLGVAFAAVDVLPDPRIRMELSALSSWPTIPQLFAHGELIGGCDIVCEMHDSGELEMALR